MIITIIAAVCENNAIGKNNQLLWRLSDDLKHFKKVTQGHFIIMGRKTFESIGIPLKGRTNIIITRNPDYRANGAIILDSLEKALLFARNENQEEVFIIGGGEIYRQALSLANRIFYTKVHAKLEGDIFFPEINMDEWEIKVITQYKKNERNDHDFEILELIRKS